MEILLMVLAPILWVGFSILEGIKEAYLYNYRDSNDLAYTKDLHPLYVMQRASMGLALAIGFLLIGPWYLAILGLTSFALMFPLFHDGFYYRRRNRISKEIYPDKFKTDQNTSTAKISVQRFAVRLALAILGAIAYGTFCWLV